MKKKIFAVAAIFISSQLFAQTDTAYHALDEIVFSASKYPRKQSSTGKIITVINRRQLEKSAGKNLGEVLHSVAGTSAIGSTNNFGTNQTLSIRGASSGNVLLLYDGIPISDPSVNTNYFDINLLSLDQVERIEIMKGGHSTLYGTDAVAGVINIIPKKSFSKKFSLDASLLGGSYNHFKQSLGIAGRTKKLNYGLQYTHEDAKGFSSAHDSTGNAGFDDDAFNSHAVSGRFGVQLSPELEIKLFSRFSHYLAELDASAFTDEKDHTVNNNNFQTGLGLVSKLRDGTLRLNYSFNYVARDYLDDSIHKGNPFVDFANSYFIGRSHFAELYGSWQWEHWELLAGLDHHFNNTQQDYFSTGTFGPYDPPQFRGKMTQFSPYSSLIYHLDDLNLELGARWTRHSEFGNHVSYTFNPSYLLRPGLKLFGNLYSAFKVPTLYQLFDPVFGNDKLKPERSITEELGIEVGIGKSFSSRLSGFYRKAKNVILFVLTDPVNFISSYQNASEQKNYGAELEVTSRGNKLSLEANYAFIDGETRAAFDGTGTPLGKDTTYYNLYRIPKHAVNISAGYQLTKKFYLSTKLHWVGEREEFIYGSSPLPLDPYHTIDLYGEYSFYNRFKVFFDLKNLTDHRYFEIPGYNSKGINFNLGITAGL